MEQISLEQAVELVSRQGKELEETELISLLQAGGRILAADIYSRMDSPPFDRSPIDGYACRSEDVSAASGEKPVRLKVLTEINAGTYPEILLEKGTCARIMTGAPIPFGCDCCIRQEDTDYGEETVTVYSSAKPWENYCFCGEDIKKGTLVLKKGTVLGYVEIGILASLGMEFAEVVRKPRVAFLTTGDEVSEPGEKLLPGKIYNSIHFMMMRRMMELSLEPMVWEHQRDDAALVADWLLKWSQKVDMILTTGGVSVGKKDIFHEALRLAEAKRIFWKVRMKPGSPAIASVLGDTIILNLSGNPFAALANFELLARPVLAKIGRNPALCPVKTKGKMADEFLKASPGRRWIRGKFRDGWIYLPEGLHSSGVLGSMAGCNCLVDIPAGTKALKKGQDMEVVLL